MDHKKYIMTYDRMTKGKTNKIIVFYDVREVIQNNRKKLKTT